MHKSQTEHRIGPSAQPIVLQGQSELISHGSTAQLCVLKAHGVLCAATGQDVSAVLATKSKVQGRPRKVWLAMACALYNLRVPTVSMLYTKFQRIAVLPAVLVGQDGS